MAVVPVILFNSDFLDVKTSHSDTRLLRYSNQNNFAGLSYSDLPTTFSLRIKSKFFIERSPEEDESDELSDGDIISLSTSLKEQVLIEVEPVPYYVHTQLKLVLKHNFLEVDSERFTKEESYEIGEPLGNGKYPFTLGKCWLTRKSSYVTNVFGEV